MANIFAIVGEYAEAIKNLAYLMSMPTGDQLSSAILQLDPTWDSLRNDPKFKQLAKETP